MASVAIPVSHFVILQLHKEMRKIAESKPGHVMGGSHPGAQPEGRAGSETTIGQHNCAPREQSFLALAKASDTYRLNISPEALTIEIQSKSIEEKTAVEPLFITD